MTQDVATKVEQFFASYRQRDYAKGQILLLNDDKAEQVHYMIAGRVKMYDVTERGEEIIMSIFKPPAFFPMSLAINGGLSPYIYEAETDISIRQAPASEVVDFLQANPDVTFDLLARVYRGMDGLLGRMTQLMGGSAHSRLVYELLIEARRFGHKSPDGSYLLTVSEKEIGARAGLSRETVSREVRKLKQIGLVVQQERHLLISNLEELQKLLAS